MLGHGIFTYLENDSQFPMSQVKPCYANGLDSNGYKIHTLFFLSFS
jgi:hypothetical protein